MFIARDGGDFRRRFSEGLAQMLSAQDPGAFILVLANSLQQPRLRTALLQAIEANFNAMLAGVEGSEDDQEVFAVLAGEGIADQQCWMHRDSGCWELVYNNMRRLRPERLSGKPFASIRQPFDDRQFNFNKAFLRPEILWQGEWRGNSFRVLYNKFPFAPWHLLIAPEAALGLPQHLDSDIHTMTWSLVESQQHVIPGFAIGYNSLGAGASVNHMHLQGFVRRKPLPVESGRWLHHGGDEAYPLVCRVATTARESWEGIEAFQRENQPFNLLYRPGRCYLLPRKPQGSVSAEEWAGGIAWYESCGVFTLADGSQLNTLGEQQIARWLKRHTLDP